MKDIVDLNAAFRVEKKKLPQNTVWGKNRWDSEASQIPYAFLAKNRCLIEQEFQDLFAVLKKHDMEYQLIDKKIKALSGLTNQEEVLRILRLRAATLQANNVERKDFWLQCYYYARMLESYNDAYGKEHKYAKWSEQIYQRFTDPANFPIDEKESWIKRITDDLSDLASTPLHIGKIRDWIGMSNLYRIHTVFCRLSVKGFLVLAEEQKLLERLKTTLGWDVNISVLDTPTNVYNALSVGLFVARFIINIGLLVKHVSTPSPKEEATTDNYDRFYLELNKRYCSLLNDVVWAGVNLCSNYGSYFNLSSAFGNGLTAGFLCFDVALLIWRRDLERQEYLIKKAQYQDELCLIPSDECTKIGQNKKILEEQLIQLEIRWDATSATYWFNVAAALTLVASFAPLLVFSAPAILTPLCFFMVTIGTSMYMSAGVFQKYQEKKYTLERLPMDESCVAEYKKAVSDDFNASWNTFIMAMIKNATIPFLITAAFTVSTPIALILAGLYIAYENGVDYVERPEQLAAPLVIIATCMVSFPAALALTTLYLGYEGGKWLLDQPEQDASTFMPKT